MADEENLNTLQYFISTNQFAQLQHIYIRLPNGNVEQMDPQIKYIFNAVAANGTTINILDADTTYIARKDPNVSDHKQTLMFRGINEDQYGYPTQYTVDVYDLYHRFEADWDTDNLKITPIPVGEDESEPDYYKLQLTAKDTTYTVDGITLQLDTRSNNKLSIKSLLTKLTAGSGILLSTAGTSPYKTTITAPGSSQSVLLDKETNLRGLITAWMYKVNPLWLSGQGASNHNVSGGLSTIIEGTIGSAISGTKSLKIKQNKTTGTPAYITSYNLDVNPAWLSGSTTNQEGYNALTAALNKYINGYYNSSNSSINTLKFDGTKVILAEDNGDVNTHLEANLCLTKNYTTLTDENPKTVTIDLKETDGTTTWDRNGAELSGSRGVTVTTTTSGNKDILVISGTLYYGDTDQNAGFISSIVKDENNCFTVYDIHTRLKGKNQIEISTPTTTDKGVTTISISPGALNQVLKTLKDNENNLYVGWELVAGDKSYYDGRLIEVDQETLTISSTLSGDEYLTTILSDDEFATGKIKIVPADADINNFGKGYLLSTIVTGTGANRKLSAVWKPNPGYITSYKNAKYSCNDTSLIFPTTQNENGNNNVVVNPLWLSTANPSAVITSVVTSYLNSLTHDTTNNTLKINNETSAIFWSEDKSGTGGDGDHGFRYNCTNGSITFPDSVATSNFKTNTFSDNTIYINPNWLSGSTTNKSGYNAIISAVTKYISGVYKTNIDISEDNATKTTLKYDTTNKKIILENDLGVNIWYRYGNTATTTDKRNASLIFEPEGGGTNSTLTGDTAISVNPTWIDERISSFLTGVSGHDSISTTLKIDTNGKLYWDEDARGTNGTSYYDDGRLICGYVDNNLNKFTIRPGANKQILSTTLVDGSVSAGWVNSPTLIDHTYTNYTDDESLTFSSPDSNYNSTIKVSEEWLTGLVSSFLTGVSEYDSTSTTLKIDTDGNLYWGTSEGGADGNNTYINGDMSLTFTQPNTVLGLYDVVSAKVNPAWLTGFANANSTAASSHKPSGGYTAIVNGLLCSQISSNSMSLTPKYYNNVTTYPVTGYSYGVNVEWLTGFYNDNTSNTAAAHTPSGGYITLVSGLLSTQLKNDSMKVSSVTGKIGTTTVTTGYTYGVNPEWLSGGTTDQKGYNAVVTALVKSISGGYVANSKTTLKYDGSKIYLAADNTGENTRYKLVSVVSQDASTTSKIPTIKLQSSTDGSTYSDQNSYKISGQNNVKVTSDSNGNIIIDGTHTHTFNHNTAYIRVNKGGTTTTTNETTTNTTTHIALIDGGSNTSRFKIVGENMDVSFDKSSSTLTLSCSLGRNGTNGTNGTNGRDGVFANLPAPPNDGLIYVLTGKTVNGVSSYGWVATGSCDS